MFSKISTSKFTTSFSEKLNLLKETIRSADSVVIGAGAGLSTSAGFEYTGERFKRYFSDFEEKYGFHDMYSGGFYPYRTPEEYWGYWSRYILVNRYADASKPVYQKLLKLIEDKDYFVITTNVDHCFQKAGFDKKRLFYTQGDYGLFQCSLPCSADTYDNEEIIRRMANEQRDMEIPSRLIPKCPRCGRPLTVNLRSDNRFVQDKGWVDASIRYEKFLKTRQNQRILFMELGVGYNTPVIIKYPFWQMTLKNSKATYVCINYGEAACPKEIESQSICIDGDIGRILDNILCN